mgnify:CR=1 FL=1
MKATLSSMRGQSDKKLTNSYIFTNKKKVHFLGEKNTEIYEQMNVIETGGICYHNRFLPSF